jgi:hypothetical protein
LPLRVDSQFADGATSFHQPGQGGIYRFFPGLGAGFFAAGFDPEPALEAATATGFPFAGAALPGGALAAGLAGGFTGGLAATAACGFFAPGFWAPSVLAALLALAAAGGVFLAAGGGATFCFSAGAADLALPMAGLASVFFLASG